MSLVHLGDIRGDAKDRQRVKNHNSKWGRGLSFTPGQRCAHHSWDNCAECTARPRRGSSIGNTRQEQRWVAAQRARKTTVIRHALHHDVDEAVYGSPYESTDDTGSNLEDDEIMYSYDAPTGPVRGSKVLSYAITEAVQRYENNETEKMVKEYDLVADGKDELEFADAEDDFELIDSAHFK